MIPWCLAAGNAAGTATAAGVKVSISPRVLKPLSFSTVHPLPSSLAQASRELPACICPPKVCGKDSPASARTQQAACGERSFLSHWKHHNQNEQKGLQKKEKNN